MLDMEMIYSWGGGGMEWLINSDLLNIALRGEGM